MGGLFTLYALLAGGVDTGWTFYAPYSSTYSNTHVMATALGIFIVGFSSILTGLNFIVTIHKMRAPGLTWFRLPLFIWAHYATSLIMVLGTPVLAITIVLVAMERLGFGIFDPELGGDPVLFQHLFWFYSHPAVYIMVLPSMGVVSEIVACFCRKRVWLCVHRLFELCDCGVRLPGVGTPHVRQRPVDLRWPGVFDAQLPCGSAVGGKGLQLDRLAAQRNDPFETPMLYALGFIGLFTIGGLTGMFVAALAVDVHVHDTYFVVAHFHYIMVGGAVMGYLGGIHFWWPKMTGRMYPEGWARLSAILIFVGFNLTFFPQFILGYLGMPRRYHVYPEEFQVLNVMSSAGASLLAVGYLFPLTYLLWSLRYGKIAGPNPGARPGWNGKLHRRPPRRISLRRPSCSKKRTTIASWMPCSRPRVQVEHE